MSKSKRRDFLRHAVLGGFLAPVAAYWPNVPEAKAQDEIRRMVLCFMPNGKMREDPFVRGRAGERPVFERGFEAYNDFAEDAIAFREYSFQHIVDNAPVIPSNSGHVDSAMLMFSGVTPHVRAPGASAHYGRAPTIDQVVAKDYLDRGLISPGGPKSLAIHVHGSTLNSISSVFVEPIAGYRLGQIYQNDELSRKWVPQHKQPIDGFRELFRGVAAMGGASSVDALWATNRGVVDVPNAELRAIHAQLPAEGVRVLDEHLAMLSDLESTLRDTEEVDPAMLPDAPPTISNVESEAGRLEAFDYWNQIIEAAFAFDRTRIATIQFGGVASRFVIPSLGLRSLENTDLGENGRNDHHTYTHSDTGEVWRFQDWYSKRVASLLRTLKNGRTNYLDTTAVMTGCEFGEGLGHVAHNIPVTIFGNHQFYNSGQIVEYSRHDRGEQHTGTLLSMVHAMGTELEFIGDAPFRGGVPEILRR